MSREIEARARRMFIDWLIALPAQCDPVSAAAIRLAELRTKDDMTPVQRHFCELLRQVTPFAPAANIGLGNRSRFRAAS